MADEELSALKLKALECKELCVELETSRKTAKIYKQLQNSNIFFREDLIATKSEAQKKLDDIEKQINELEGKNSSEAEELVST